MYVRVYMCLCSVSAYIVRDGEIEETTLIFERESALILLMKPRGQNEYNLGPC